MIPAGTPASTGEHAFEGVPAGSHCAVTETRDGQTGTVTATVTGNNQRVAVNEGDVQRATVPAAGTSTVKVTDIYQPSFVPVTG